MTAPRLPRPVAWLLRAEGLALLVASVLGYRALGGGWGPFALGLLLPDLAMLAYLAGPRAGAAGYNAAHTTLAPAALAALGWAAGSGAAVLAALVWLAHVGLDRALGFGLKTGAFADTHLT